MTLSQNIMSFSAWRKEEQSTHPLDGNGRHANREKEVPNQGHITFHDPASHFRIQTLPTLTSLMINITKTDM